MERSDDQELTLNTTNPLPFKNSNKFPAFDSKSQYGHGAVQNSYIPSLFSPSFVSVGTLNANTSFSRYCCQRLTIASSCVRAVSDGAEERKNVGERREVKSEAKSGGVTSETNQGIDLGLRGARKWRG